MAALSVVRRLPGIKEMQSIFVLKEIKPFVAFPVKRPAISLQQLS